MKLEIGDLVKTVYQHETRIGTIYAFENNRFRANNITILPNDTLHYDEFMLLNGMNVLKRNYGKISFEEFKELYPEEFI